MRLWPWVLHSNDDCVTLPQWLALSVPASFSVGQFTVAPDRTGEAKTRQFV